MSDTIEHIGLSWKSIDLFLQLRNNRILDNHFLELISHSIDPILSIIVSYW
jgi:hypothetical protein